MQRELRTIRLALVALALLLGAQGAQAQLKFGVRAGIDVSKARPDASVLESSNRAGFVVGPALNLTLPLTGLNLEAAALYHNRSVKLSDDYDRSASETLHSIDIPITAKYAIGLGSLASVYVGTGPQFGFNLGDESILKKSYSLKSSEFSWNIGAGVNLIGHLQVGYNYNIGIGKTAEADELGTYWEAVTGGLKNNTHQIQVTYWF